MADPVMRGILLKRALDHAAVWHREQRRKYPNVDVPYMSHLAGVAVILSRHGFDDEVVAAGALHDVIEDSGVSYDDLTRLFLYARDRCDGRECVREIGDFVAHHNERFKGLVTRTSRDWFLSALNVAGPDRHFEWKRLPPIYIEFIEAQFRKLHNAIIAPTRRSPDSAV